MSIHKLAQEISFESAIEMQGIRVSEYGSAIEDVQDRLASVLQELQSCADLVHALAAAGDDPAYSVLALYLADTAVPQKLQDAGAALATAVERIEDVNSSYLGEAHNILETEVIPDMRDSYDEEGWESFTWGLS